MKRVHSLFTTLATIGLLAGPIVAADYDPTAAFLKDISSLKVGAKDFTDTQGEKLHDKEEKKDFDGPASAIKTSSEQAAE